MTATKQEPILTRDSAKTMPFEDLVVAAHGLVDKYRKPDGFEEEQEQHDRISRTIDELPDVYGFLLTLHSYFDHWTDAFAEMHGRQSPEYKSMRQRRDAMERAASHAKRRYEGASRMATVLMSHQDEARMPRSRG